MNSRSKKPAPLGSHKLRIIGGRWRSRSLAFPAIDGLRPTGDRIRETLFNWLMPVLPGSRCLDLFAGSGILGFEALSRGASTCTLVELHPAALQQLRENAALLQADAVEIVHANALEFLNTRPAEAYDVVFLDPPFDLNLWQPALDKLSQGWLNNGAFVYVETPRDASPILAAHWHLHRQKQSGQVCYSLYRYETNRNPAM